MSNATSTRLAAAGIGLLAGCRSMAAPALVSHELVRRRRSLPDSLGFLARPEASAVLKVLGSLETVADKLPVVGSRTAPPSLIVRTLSGGLSGAAVCAAEGEAAEVGAVIGAAGAIAGTFLAYHLRRRLGEVLPVPDSVLGLAEDLLVVSAGTALLRTLESGNAPAEDDL